MQSKQGRGRRYSPKPARGHSGDSDEHGSRAAPLTREASASDEPAVKMRPAKHYALWLLGRREWSAKELEQRLRLKGYPDQDIAACLEFCQQHGLQSDSRFAASKVRTRAASHGNRRISQELSLKGVSPEDRLQALSEAGDETERAQEAARRFEDKPWSLELKSKAWRFLMSRGFSTQAIGHALKALECRAKEHENEGDS